MKFVCQNCHSRYHVDDSKVVGRILRIRCKRCNHIITVRQLEPPQPTLLGADQQPPRSAGQSLSPSQSIPPPPVHKARKVDYDRLEELQWFYSVNGQSFGPFNEDDLIAKCLSGQLGDETFVWNAGMETWRPVMEVPVFAPAIMEAIRRHPQTPTLEVSDPADGGSTFAKPPSIPGARVGKKIEPKKRLASTAASPSTSPGMPRPSGSFETAPRSLRQLTPSLGVPPVKARRDRKTPTSSTRAVDAAENASLDRLRALRARLLGATSGEYDPKKHAPPRLVTGSRPAPRSSADTRLPVKSTADEGSASRPPEIPLEPGDALKASDGPKPGSRSGTISAPLPAVDSVDPWFESSGKTGGRSANESGAEFSLDTRDLAAVTVDSIPQEEASTPPPRGRPHP